MAKHSQEQTDNTYAKEQIEMTALLETLKQPFPGASVSLKHQRIDLFGEASTAITFISDKGSSICWLSPIQRGLRLQDLSQEEEQYLLWSNQVDVHQSVPPLEIYLHAALPVPTVIYFASEAILSLSSSDTSSQLLSEILCGKVKQIEFAAGVRIQAKTAAAAWKNGLWALVIPHRGLLVAGACISEAGERLAEIQKKSEDALRSNGAWETTVSVKPQSNMNISSAAMVRKQLSLQTDAPMVICWTDQSGLDPAPTEKCLLMQSQPYLKAESMVKNAELGIGFLGNDAEEAKIARNAYEMEQRIAQRAAKLGKVSWLESVPEFIPAKKAGIFRGEVALVTGSASGIGKACVHSFLARGAAVVGVDINPFVTNMLDRPDYLGIICDLTDEEAIRSTLAKVAASFGGLDMLVLNAGIFPPSIRIESLAQADFERVMEINLNANLNLMREAHPFLKNAPLYGRVVINASRNALAPGIGAVAYSVSKMALTQLARTAALEWAEEGIRVNVVHPDAVFDTGVWSDEILKARAENYHMTVEQYKRRNLLKTELTSRDVSEMIVEMCGPLFSKITGAQLPVDGGSDRVI